MQHTVVQLIVPSLKGIGLAELVIQSHAMLFFFMYIYIYIVLLCFKPGKKWIELLVNVYKQKRTFWNIGCYTLLHHEVSVVKEYPSTFTILLWLILLWCLTKVVYVLKCQNFFESNLHPLSGEFWKPNLRFYAKSPVFSKIFLRISRF